MANPSVKSYVKGSRNQAMDVRSITIIHNRPSELGSTVSDAFGVSMADSLRENIRGAISNSEEHFRAYLLVLKSFFYNPISSSKKNFKSSEAFNGKIFTF